MGYVQKIAPPILIVNAGILIIFIVEICKLNLGLPVEMLDKTLKSLPIIWSLLLVFIVEVELRRKFDKTGKEK